MSHGHDDHGHDDHAAPVSTASSTPTLGGTPKWIGWIITGAFVVLLLLFLFIWKPWKNSDKDLKPYVEIPPFGTTDTIPVPYGFNYHIEDGDYGYKDNLTTDTLDGSSENKRGDRVKWFILNNKTNTTLDVKIVWIKKF